MKIIVLFLLLLTSILLSQTIENKTINKLMLESKYSQVVALLEDKELKGAELTDKEKFNLAISYQRLLNHNKAIRTLSFLRKKTPNDQALLFLLGESYKAMGSVRAAKSVYEMVIEKDSSNIIARIELAKLSVESKKYGEAKNIYQFLILQDSSNSYYLRQCGYVLYRLNANKEAEKYLKEAIKINEYDPKAALWLAKIFFDKQMYNEAIEIIKNSTKFNPVNLPLNKLYAEVLFKMKKYNSASGQYNNVIVLGDSSSVIFQKLGLSLYSSVATRDSLEENKKEVILLEAIEALEKSVEKEKTNNALTLTYLGFCFKALKKYDEAIPYLEKALNAMTPDYIDRVYSTLGASYELSEKYPEAIKSYSKSLEYSNKDSHSVFRLATLYDRYYADKRVAIAHYKKYLRLVDDTNDVLTNYSKKRISDLKEYNHFKVKN